MYVTGTALFLVFRGKGQFGFNKASGTLMQSLAILLRLNFLDIFYGRKNFLLAAQNWEKPKNVQLWGKLGGMLGLL